MFRMGTASLLGEKKLSADDLKKMCQTIESAFPDHSNYNQLYATIAYIEATIGLGLLPYTIYSFIQKKLFEKPEENIGEICIYLFEILLLCVVVGSVAKQATHTAYTWYKAKMTGAVEKTEFLKSDQPLPATVISKIANLLPKLQEADAEASYIEYVGKVNTYGDLAMLAEQIMYNYPEAKVELPYFSQLKS